MVGIFVSIALKAIDYLIQPILHPFLYVVNFNRNIKELMQKVEQLEATKSTIQHWVEAARRNGEDIEKDVESWLSRVEGIISEVQIMQSEIELHKTCLSGWCPNCIYCYRLSRRSSKQTSTVVDLLQKAKFNSVSHMPSHPGITFLASKDFIAFDSTTVTMNEILSALRDEKIDIVGIFGPQGIGKTALAKEVGIKAQEEKMFEKVVMAVVGRTPNVEQIQYQIADMLGLKLTEKSESGKAYRLYRRLKSRENFLIILDDVCKMADLRSWGIPSAEDTNGCKILLTTRSEHVCDIMGSTMKITVSALSEEESWVLLRRVVGEDIDAHSYKAVAAEIISKCAGLPSLLVTIGRSLRNKNLEQWKYVSQQLNKSKQDLDADNLFD